MPESSYEFTIKSLGERTIQSPVYFTFFQSDENRVLFNNYLNNYDKIKTAEGLPLSVELAGPREKIFFNPAQTKAAIVTCGGLCPGINDVIRSVVIELYHQYGVKNIIGIKYGYQGLIAKYGHPLIELTPDDVDNIHVTGGSILSSSRGRQDVPEMINTLKRLNIDILFCVGGDGTMRGADILTEEIAKRKLNISIIGIPKTIDNDLTLIQKTFGFDTAISEAVKAISCAHVESKGAPNGIGLVKIMGRQSGQIAAGTVLSQSDVNFVLIPEIPFDLHGDKGFLKMLERRLIDRGHCVILVAEGAGQEHIKRQDAPIETDASGNLKLADVGRYLKEQIEKYFFDMGKEINLKYIDPSYMIRSVPANASDSNYCNALGQYAVHAGMAGKTGMLVGLMKDEFVHLPFKCVTSGRKIDPEGNIWMRVLETTGQPIAMKN
ncbi:MAG: ATP-dependent 6-phosphofructokinase [Syntrophaceae bacterium]|nr:ATP-dependent 6-phosphofructokinase [Syntrophaceae bacterium]